MARILAQSSAQRWDSSSDTADAPTGGPTFLQQLPVLLSRWDRRLRNVGASQSHEEWFGRPPADMLGTHLSGLFGHALLVDCHTAIKAAFAGRESQLDRMLVDGTGRQRHVQIACIPTDAGASSKAVSLVITDLTPRVEAQAALDEAQRIARIGSWSLRPDAEELIWSDELYRIFGVDRESFSPALETAMELVHPDDRAELLEILGAAVGRGEPYVATYRICRPDGTVREVESRGRPTRGADVQVVRIAGTLQDVTEERASARVMARVNSDLRQLNEVNADVISMLGHDVRTPLAVVLGYLEQLDECWEESPARERKEQIRRAHRSAVRLRGLVDDILTLATVDAGVIHARAEQVDLGPLVREVLEEVPGGRDITFSATDAGASAYADAFHLRQILVNLLTNALKYGEPPYVLAMEDDVEAGVVRISVTDQGDGVAPEMEDRIFERFAADPSAPSSGSQRSTGFGLYMSDRLARTNRGALTYTPPDDERGTTFTLTLPANPEPS